MPLAMPSGLAYLRYVMKMKSTKQGWTKAGRNYRHESGIELINQSFSWLVVGGKNDGRAYKALHTAMYEAAKTEQVWA